MGELFSTIFNGMNLALAGAVIATIMAGIGSAKGVSLCGQAASGLLSEDPSKFGKALVLQALPMTQGIYGLVTALLIFIKLNLFAGGPATPLSPEDGIFYFVAALPIAVVGLISGILQGKVAASGIVLISKRGDELGHAITNAALVETFAILAVLVSLIAIIFH
ncbi:MAG: V-type ATP synthase subunit K [Clostridia bacterium]|nr:V-type ATP synthase subunit K [Clostridia bacterium]MBQ7728315.1 V-type ATP synthase subunit K [Clostridia bacterium]